MVWNVWAASLMTVGATGLVATPLITVDFLSWLGSEILMEVVFEVLGAMVFALLS